MRKSTNNGDSILDYSNPKQLELLTSNEDTPLIVIEEEFGNNQEKVVSGSPQI